LSIDETPKSPLKRSWTSRTSIAAGMPMVGRAKDQLETD
jgi:hypothetical protein